MGFFKITEELKAEAEAQAAAQAAEAQKRRQQMISKWQKEHEANLLVNSTRGQLAWTLIWSTTVAGMVIGTIVAVITHL